MVATLLYAYTQSYIEVVQWWQRIWPWVCLGWVLGVCWDLGIERAACNFLLTGICLILMRKISETHDCENHYI